MIRPRLSSAALIMGALALPLLACVACAPAPRNEEPPPPPVENATVNRSVAIEEFTLAAEPPIAEEDIREIAVLQRQINLLAEAVIPSVVSITTTRTVERPALPPPLERFLGERLPEEIPRTALGSGVIITEEGLIATNNHIVADTRKSTCSSAMVVPWPRRSWRHGQTPTSRSS